MRRLQLLASFALAAAAVACATPRATPVAVGPVAPARGERVQLDQSLLVVDTSGSIGRRSQFPGEKALVQALVASAPEGGYEAGGIAFGGFRREGTPLAPFDRSALAGWAAGLRHLDEATPLERAIGEASAALDGKRGRAAITLVSDGRPTDAAGRPAPGAAALQAATEAAAAYDGQLCIHTVQVGDDPEGAAFLQQLARATGCGSHRAAATLDSAAALQAFQREVYLGAAPAPKAAPREGDRDGDGVLDTADRCPGTPAGARVDARGCWVIDGLHFGSDSAEIEPASRARLLRDVVPVLQRETSLRIRIDGHTDSRGDDGYNQKLSERRAESVRRFLTGNGIAADRLEARGFGESQPVAPNDTPENLRRNRRTELTVLGQ